MAVIKTCVLFRMPLMLGRLCCPWGSNPFWHPLTESSGVVGMDPPHLRCSSRLAARLESRTGLCRRAQPAEYKNVLKKYIFGHFTKKPTLTLEMNLPANRLFRSPLG